MVTSDNLNWYAAYTRVNQELIIKKKLDELGIENYLPQEEQVRDTPLGRKKIRVILIHGMIFIRTDKATSFSLLNDYLLNIVYLKDRENRHSLIIPDKQMQDFMFLLDFSTEGVEVLNKDLKRGDRVRVIKGSLQGLEGELVRLKGHKRVVVRLEGVASIATSFIPGSFLEKITRNNGKEFISRVVQADMWVDAEGLSPVISFGTLAWLLVCLFYGESLSVVGRRI